MKDTQLKPWQVDESNDDSLDSPETRSSKAEESTRWSASSSLQEAQSEPVTNRGGFVLGVSAAFALLPIGLALFVVVCLDMAPFTVNGSIVGWARWSLAGLIASSGLILVANYWGRRRSFHQMLGALDRLGRGKPDGTVDVPTDLRPVWQAIEHHARLVGERVGELADMHRKMQLDLTLAETNRRRTLAIVNALAEPVIVTDAFDQITLINAAAAELTGVDADAALRKRIDDVVNDAEVVKTIKESRAADARAADRRKEYAIGEQVFSLSASPLGARDGEEGHSVVTIFRDITREHDASRKKSEFVSHVAHELRTPLSSIRAYVEMLVDGEANDAQTRQEYYDIIQTSAERLGRLIDNMLNISRIEAGTVRIHREPIGLSLIVKEAVDMMKPSADEKKLELAANLTPVMYRVDADRDLLYQAILNLISNAIKYTPDGGKVIVRMTPQEERKRVLVEVEDTGAGIPKEDLPKMFGKFFRVEANKKLAKGTGLGLNLVKKIVEDVHGGEISLRSEVGEGSTFTIALPLSD